MSLKKIKTTDKEIIIVIIVTAALVIALGFIVTTGLTIKDLNEKIYKDPWSKNCQKDQYLIIQNDSNKCEILGPCSNDFDCSYLEINKLPPRYGTCIEGKCVALCGSGIMRMCIN